MQATEAVSRMRDVRSSASGEATPTPPEPFEKPSPGAWTLDAAHCERPLPRIMQGVLEDAFARGNREGAAAYGVLLDTFEVALVNGFMYACARPYGAPAEPKGPPPKALFKLLSWVHPGVRKRLRDCDRAFAQKLWRAETQHYLEVDVPGIEERARALLAFDRASAGDAQLAAHVSECRALLIDDLYTHARVNFTRFLPVGDLIAHVREWIGADATETLRALRGSSPSSEEGLAELAALAERVSADDALVARLRSPELDPEALLSEMERRDDEIGAAARAWIARVGHRVTGFSPGYPTSRETPNALLTALAAALDARWASSAAEHGNAAAKRLRERVPEPLRGAFDALMEEARAVYFIRDHSTIRNAGTLGILRLALLEVGRRLHERGLVTDARVALDLLPEEVGPALRGERGVDLAAAHRWYAWRERATSELAPERLGPPASPPPPLEWLPPGARRLAAALEAYLHAMLDEHAPVERSDAEARVIQGMAASPGKRTGIARLVLEPGDFGRVQPGDVLVARMTAPTYNVLLPLLAGIVTDRGGVLSHPAIVSREYGIPGVVGTRVATASIPDGALVEIDGDKGLVRVLS